MKDRSKLTKSLSQQEGRLIEQLRQHPEMMERIQHILALTDSADGPLKTADQIEELLIEEMRKLGGVTMHHWARQAQERVSRELKSGNTSIRSRKKKR